MSRLKLVEPGQLAFSYEQLPEPVALEARQAAERIRVRLRRTAEDIIMIGKDLLDTKEHLPHGSFLPWIDAEFGMSNDTARRFMNVGSVYGDKFRSLPNLDKQLPTALYELAAPKTPIEVREEIEAMIAAGEVVKRETIIELRQRLDDSQKAVEDLAARNSQLSAKKKAAPKTDVDVDKIREEAAAEIRAQFQVRIDALSEANVEANAALKTLRAQADAAKQPGDEPGNIVHPDFNRGNASGADVADEYGFNSKAAISAFSGALGSMEGLEFSPAEFWRQQGKDGTHGKRLHQALLSVNATISLLIKEYAQ